MAMKAFRWLTQGRKAERAGRLARALRREDSGSTLIEFALSATVLFSLVFCFMETCLAFYTHDLISELAREGTRYAMVRGATCPTAASPTCEVTASQVNAWVAAIKLPNLAGGKMTINTTYPNGNEAVGSTVSVQITYVFPITMPFVPQSSLTMSSTSQAYIVQ